MKFTLRPYAAFFLMFGFIAIAALPGTTIKLIGAACFLAGLGMCVKKVAQESSSSKN